MKIGIIFGGYSKEREISFAGGRTVYDNLNKSIFEPIPIFIDSFGNLILINWEYIYKGSIRDFYPPVEFIPNSQNKFQIYAESLGNLSFEEQEKLIQKIGKIILPSELKKTFDFAFLCLHGVMGEDGQIQGLLEYFKIPYSGSGILPSAIGINKVVQKKLMRNAGFNMPNFISLKRAEWFEGNVNQILENVKAKVKFPCVIKAATQGSTIGISLANNENEFNECIDMSFFTSSILKQDWDMKNKNSKSDFVRKLVDIRDGIGVPIRINKSELNKIFYHPAELLLFIEKHFELSDDKLFFESLDGEDEVIIEEYITGKEFSCIVIQDENGNPIALPPTEIIKSTKIFDYQSKYMPGLSRKVTPINLPIEQIQNIRNECEKLFLQLSFDVYARIDGFINEIGIIFLNDPNTTSGMMPSSFFFHQAAEIGLNPSQFITYIIRTSIIQRIAASKNNGKYDNLLFELDELIFRNNTEAHSKIKVAVILGGYSSERHISVESGRNVYEKLASSSKYEAIPIFLTGNEKEHQLYQIPINILLKDNADDIKEKIENYKIHPVINDIVNKCSAITKRYSKSVDEPKRIFYADLPKIVDVVFLALHGRPGEDGEVQSILDKINIPYNGSGAISSALTINKFETNELLRKNGFLIAEHVLVHKAEWVKQRKEIIEGILKEIQLPFIAKPVDDGCSSAVRKIKTLEELEAYASVLFRVGESIEEKFRETLNISDKEEFPIKDVFLIEELISKKDADVFIEITGGMLTKLNSENQTIYEVFEASETLSQGEVLSLEEKFLAGQGQNITPARYSQNLDEQKEISLFVKAKLGEAAKCLNVAGYCRIDAFVRIFNSKKVEVIFIEVNSLPGMTPATCIFHQAAIDNLQPYEFIDKILEFAMKRNSKNIN